MTTNGNPNNNPLGTGVQQPPISMPPPVSGSDQQAQVNARIAQAAVSMGLPPHVLPSNHPLHQQLRDRQAQEAALAQQRLHRAQQFSSARGRAVPPPQPTYEPEPLAFVVVAQDEEVTLRICSLNDEKLQGYVLIVTTPAGAVTMSFVPQPV